MRIAVASGKGGTGKTFVSTNLFELLRNQKKEVVLVDCDAEEPNAGEFLQGDELDCQNVYQSVAVIDSDQCKFCGECLQYCSYHAIVMVPSNHFIHVIEDQCRDCGACTYACHSDVISLKRKLLGTIRKIRIGERALFVEGRSELGVYSPVKIIKRAVQSIAKDSYVLLDSPPGISCPFVTTVSMADYVILVTEPTPFGLNDLKLSVATLDQLGIPYGVVINRGSGLNNIISDWLQKERIPFLAKIPFDRDIAEIYSEGRLLVNENFHFRSLFEHLFQTVEKEYLLCQK